MVRDLGMAASAGKRLRQKSRAPFERWVVSETSVVQPSHEHYEAGGVPAAALVARE